MLMPRSRLSKAAADVLAQPRIVLGRSIWSIYIDIEDAASEMP